MTTASSRVATLDTAALPFASILCWIDGCRPAAEAAHEAALLAGPRGRLELIAINWKEGARASARATIAPQRLAEALADASAHARELGAHPETVTLVAHDQVAALLKRAAEHDLLVVGGYGGSRAEGMLMGSPTSVALHRAPTPVLVARRSAALDDFPWSILVALSADPSAEAVIQAAARIARDHRAHTAIVAPPERRAQGISRLVAAGVEALGTATGAAPELLVDGDPAHRSIVRCAADFGASLVVMGTRARPGVRALGSVSERVAHSAPCSVLVMRPHAPSGQLLGPRVRL